MALLLNSLDNDREEAAAEDTADQLEAAATGFEPTAAPGRRDGFYASPLGLVAAAIAVIIALLFFTPLRGPGLWTRDDVYVPRGEAVAASQRLADIAAEQRLADARAAAWVDVPAIDAHAGTFTAQTPSR